MPAEVVLHRSGPGWASGLSREGVPCIEYGAADPNPVISRISRSREEIRPAEEIVSIGVGFHHQPRPRCRPHSSSLNRARTARATAP